MADRGKTKWDDKGDITEQPVPRIGGAIVLIALGVLFLLSQNGLLTLEGNWWAIFIALPALALLWSAYSAYQRDGTLSTEVTSKLTGGIIVGLIALLAAINQLTQLFPLLLIVIGIFVALGWRQPRSHRH